MTTKPQDNMQSDNPGHSDKRSRPPIAIVGMGAIMPDAPTAPAFWANITGGRYSIADVPKDRWDPGLYYDPDPRAPDKTYSRIGGWVREFPWDPIGWRLPLPPKVSDQMDDTQKWAVAAAREALIDAGWPGWNVDPERVAVVIGSALGGQQHYATTMRIQLPEFTRELVRSATFASLPASTRDAVIAETSQSFLSLLPDITEDTMPGELSNIIAGRIANLFNFRGMSFTTDAACASGLAGLSAAVAGLADGQCDAVITGGVDRNMGAGTFVKFCKIGALSATGTRPFDAGADGFVMGEGAALFVLKRLADAERDGDRIYAVLLGIGGSSDGKGKGITAPNPVGQRLAVARAWHNADVDPATVSCIEAHGTSTRVGDASELESLSYVFRPGELAPGSIALGSVKSNIGHLKGAAGTAGLFKQVMALHEKVLPPSLNFREPNPNVDWATSPFRVNGELREWPEPPCGVRRAGVSAFGFGGTNFHAVVEEYIPGRYHREDRQMFAVSEAVAEVVAGAKASTLDGQVAVSAAPAGKPATAGPRGQYPPGAKRPLRGALVVGGDSEPDVAAQLTRIRDQAASGQAPAPVPPDPALAAAAVRVAIDYGEPAELADKAAKAVQALTGGAPELRKMLRSRGVFIGHGPAPKTAFLYTGQGSQYVNMLRELRDIEPIVAQTFAEADEIMTPLLGKPLTSYIYVDSADQAAVAEAEKQLLQTEITQPAVLAADLALTRMLAAYGIKPDMVMGHSLGEYGALLAAGALTFPAALEAVSARGREMASLEMPDKGAMAAVMAPLAEIERIITATDGYVVIANINSTHQAVIGGATEAVERAVEAFTSAGYTASRIPVSHAFHTSIVAPASEPLRRTLSRLDIGAPQLPIVANVDGEFYPPDGQGIKERMLDILGRQVSSPVQFVKGLGTLYEAGARVFVEVGPKRALAGFADDVLGSAHDDVLALFTNHPKYGDVPSFNAALCGLYAAGLGYPAQPEPAREQTSLQVPAPAEPVSAAAAPLIAPISPVARGVPMPEDRYAELGRLVADLIDRGRDILAGAAQREGISAAQPAAAPSPAPNGAARPLSEPVVITGAALGLPGTERVFDDENVARILSGQQFIDMIPRQVRRAMVDKHITRLVKSEAGDPVFETIENEGDVIKLAGRYGTFDVTEEFGVDADRNAALDQCTRLAIGAGLDALRDAGIPLVLHYHATTLGTRLPDHWLLPDGMRDDTGVIFASAFPGYDSFAEDLNRYHEDRARRHERSVLEDIRARMSADDQAAAEVDRRIAELRHRLQTEPFAFDRRFLFRALSMGHSQFAELIGARGPNTQLNAACASTAQALSVAEDWIRSGRCRRVIVISADDVTSDTLLPWTGSGFLATGAAATDAVVEDAALPFDKRRHGMILGSGAAALVVESADAARERGIRPICEILATVTANSAFHGTRLDVQHITQVMEQLIRKAEGRGIDRKQIAGQAMFVSHETYTPARGGSASAEISALRTAFGAAADSIVIANTKGFTGHAMGAGIEEVVAVKALETGIVPPVPNFREPDPELGQLNLSRGGVYPVRYALRLAAGFGSQISMALLHWIEPADGAHRAPSELGFAYRIADETAWRSWLAKAAGHGNARLEVVQRRLRVVDETTGQPPAPVQPAPRPAAHVAPAAQSVAERPAAPATVPAAATVPTAATVPQAAPAQTALAEPQAADPVAEAVLDIVENLTGYPRDLLDLDLDLEADLGIDTVKQAEVFAAVRERFAIPRQDNLRLRDFPTLTHVIGFVHDHTDQAPAAGPTETAGAPAAESPAGAAVAGAGPAEAAEPAPPSADPVADAVLDIVESLTGYPRDLLDLDLDLEADLGIDTVKQAEVFAAVRERFAIPRQDNLRLRDFPTLTHVIGFVHDHAVPAQRSGAGTGAGPAPGAADSQPAPQQTKAAPAPVQTEPAFTGDTAAAQRLPRRLPVPVLRPPAQWCKPTGVTLGQPSRVIVMADEGGVAKALVKRLGSLGVAALVIEPGCTADGVESRLTGWLAEGPVHGLYWLAALDAEPALSELDLAGWREALRRRVKNLYAVVRRLDQAGQLGQDGTFLVAGTRMGGYHGYDDAGATAPLGGAVTGFVKAYWRERPDALAKAVDFPGTRKTAALADALIEETLCDPGAVEIGRADGRRWAVGLREVPFGDGSGGMTLDSQTVFAVTGAAGAIVSAIVADLAKASGGSFHLIDLAPEPDPADPDLIQFAADRNAFKKTIAERLAAAGTRPTPVLIERELARCERLQSALIAIQAVRAAGGQAYYHAADLTDPDAVASVMADIRGRHGRVDVLMHAAGLEISRAIADKEPREYDLVFDVKSDGLFNLLHAAGDLPVGAVVAFSSVAGRFGNAGQTDYSAANDLLCKIMSSFRTTRPGTRGIAIDWTAWGGLGMATRGSIPKVMAMAGIEMLPPEAGIAWVGRELSAGSFSGEVVVGRQLGLLTAEPDITGGLDPAAIDTSSAGPMVGTVTGMGVYSGLSAQTTLDPAAQPFLHDHRIDGTPVLPGVMGIEAFAALARLAVPDMRLADVEQVDFIAPLKFYRDEPRTITVTATVRPDGADLVADCTLSASRVLAGEQVPRVTSHFTGRVRFTGTAAERERAKAPGAHAAQAVTRGDIYHVFFHGPAYQVVEEAWQDGPDAVSRLARHLPAGHTPQAEHTTTEPRLAEACFQTAGLWEIGHAGHMALPAHADLVSMPDRLAPGAELFAVAHRGDDGSFDCQVLDGDGDVVLRVSGYRTVELDSPLPADLRQPIRDAMSV